MKVFHVTPYYPPHLGGLQQAVKNLAIAQSKNGLDVTIITSNKPRATNIDTQKDGVNLIRLRTIEIGHTPIMPLLLSKLLFRIKKEDIVHVHFAQLYVNEIVAIYSKITKHKFIFHYHGDVLPTGPLGKLLPFYKKYVLKLSINQSAAVIYPSIDFKNHLTKQLPFLESKHSYVLPNGINLPKVSNNNRTTGRKFLSASRLSKVKNIHTMIESFVEAKKRARDIELYIAGQGEETATLRKLVYDLKAGHYIHFLGNLDQEKLKKYYIDSSVFLVTAKRESFGMSIAEAMSYGLPIIAFDTPGVREIVKNNFNGFAVSPFDRNLFADAIVELATNIDKRIKLSKNAFKSATAFECCKVAKGYNNIYKEISYSKETLNNGIKK